MNVMRRANLGLLLLLVLAAGCDRADDLHAQAAEAREQVRDRLGPVTALDTATAFRLSNTFRAAADRALPAVVFISVTAPGGRVAHGNFRVPEQLRPFFDDVLPPDSVNVPPQQGTGSGFIVDTEGHIMTNHHVVGNASRILVRLLDGREYDARLIGSDANTDVAIIKIDARAGETLPVSTIGNSDELRVGDWVLALGNPLGFDFTVTAGIVSAKGRQLNVARETALESYIQTDAAINRGNSGGPLVDLFGRVVGMNTAISGPTFVGYGFAVPIALAGRVADDLRRHGFVRRPRIGVYVQDVTAVDAEVYGLAQVRGAEVVAVQAGLPAAQAGMRAGDVVLAIDGQRIQDRTEFTERLARRQPGDRVELTIWRDRAERQVTVRLGEFERPESAGTPEQRAAARAPERLGFAVRPLRGEESRRSGGRGVAIDSVERGGPAAGVQPGHVLLSINGRAVSSPDEVANLARSLEAGTAVSLRLLDAELGEMVVNFRTRR